MALTVYLDGTGFEFQPQLTPRQLVDIVLTYDPAVDVEDEAGAAAVRTFELVSCIFVSASGVAFDENINADHYSWDESQCVLSVIQAVRALGVDVTGTINYSDTGDVDTVGTLAGDGRIYFHGDVLPPALGGSLASGEAAAVRAILDRLPTHVASIRAELEGALGFGPIAPEPPILAY